MTGNDVIVIATNATLTNESVALTASPDSEISTQVLLRITQIYVPLIIFVGLIGNTLSVIVFFSTKLREMSSSYYLSALATADCGVLLALMIVWLNSLDVRWYTKNGGCQMVIYLTFVCSFLSVWFVVAFTVERFIAVCYPLHRPTMCTVKRAKMTIGGLSLVSLIMYSYTFVMVGMIEENGQSQCLLFPQYLEAMTVLNNVDTVITLIVPFIVIVSMNVTIALKVIAFYKRRAEMNGELQLMPNHSPQSSRGDLRWRCHPRMQYVHNRQFVNGAPANQSSVSLRNSHLSGSLRSSQGYITRRGPGRSSYRDTLRSRNQIRITKMLLFISTVFILLNLPSHAVRIYVFIQQMRGGFQPTSRLERIQQYTQLIYYTNFAINFFLYSLAGANFRKALKNLEICNICCCTSSDRQSDEGFQPPLAVVHFPLKPIIHSSRSRDSCNSQNSSILA